MKKSIISMGIMLITLLATTASCIDEVAFADTPQGNFEALWKIMDEHYCFFDYKKQQLGIDWKEVYDKYKPRVKGADDRQLFEVLADMLSELKDGHVNLVSSFDYGRNWSWKEDYPVNFYEEIYNKYVGTDYRIAAGIPYTILDDNIGYMRVSTFNYDPGDGNLDNILLYLMPCRSLIIDIRENGGGLLTSASKLAARFTNKEITVGYMSHKTGRGHNDFSPMQERRLKPSANIRWHKPVFVLTNRGVYSAANEFVMYMQQCPQCTVIGDTTGGGAGLPFNSELPNGWGVRFSACPVYDVNRNPTEHGIQPDVQCAVTEEDILAGRDTMIERARAMTE